MKLVSEFSLMFVLMQVLQGLLFPFLGIADLPSEPNLTVACYAAVGVLVSHLTDIHT